MGGGDSKKTEINLLLCGVLLVSAKEMESESQLCAVLKIFFVISNDLTLRMMKMVFKGVVAMGGPVGGHFSVGQGS